MSANDWQICKQCRERAIHAVPEPVEQSSDASYGRVSRNEYERLLDADRHARARYVAALDAARSNLTRTLREDYEFDLDMELGGLRISYKGECAKCGWLFEYKTTVDITPITL